MHVLQSFCLPVNGSYQKLWSGKNKQGAGLDGNACHEGACFSEACQPSFNLAEHRNVVFVMHNKAHE